MPRDPEPTWRQLVRLEPRLAELEADALGVLPSEAFCANQVWYHDLKPRLCDLIGYGRRRSDCSRPDDPPPLGEGRSYITASEILGPNDRRGRLRAHRHNRIRRREAHEGLAVLWTSGAYDRAYDYLYDLLPDCRDGCACERELEAMAAVPLWTWAEASEPASAGWEWADE